MMGPSSVRYCLVTAVGGIGWMLGSYYERLKVYDTEADSKPTLTPLPALPVFGTVSAATVFDSKKEIGITAVQNRTASIMKFGFPSLENVRSYADYVLSYDKKTRVANWVFEHLTPERLNSDAKIDRSLCDFTEDMTIHPYFRARNKDYFKSGFDRGHLAAAGNHRVDQIHVEQTFMLTNIAPQVGVGFNRHSWNRLEKYVRKKGRSHPNTYVCTGPLYVAKREGDGKMYVKYQVIGDSHVAVPTHFFKVIVFHTKDDTFHLEAYMMPNQVISDDTPLETFRVPPDMIERSSGLLFFDKISLEKLVLINGKKNTAV